MVDRMTAVQFKTGKISDGPLRLFEFNHSHPQYKMSRFRGFRKNWYSAEVRLLRPLLAVYSSRNRR